MKRVLIRIRKAVVHVLILLLTFAAAVFAFERMINQTTSIMAEGMEASSYPLVYVQNHGVSYNCLHGYEKEMDVTQIRDTVTVLGSDHLLDIEIQLFDTSVDQVSYEILTLDGQESLENTSVVKLTEEGGAVYATLSIQNYMKMKQEYMLKLKVTAGGRDLYFYTRLIQEDGLHLEAYLNFVNGFYEKCINKTSQESLAECVEPNEETGTSETLAFMNIHDTVNQLMWGNLNPQIYYKPTPSLVDINETTASFVLEYRISAAGDTETSEIYNVKEFYRLRYTDTRIFLLDFTRTTGQIFRGENTILEENGINLGIRDMEVEYQYNDKKDTVAFVQENELWSYRISNNKMARIFGFPQSENMDYRDFYSKNDIKILEVEASGNVWFAVAGYMNRGRYEGENGIAVYYYDDASATVEEKIMIQSEESFDELSLDSKTLAYVTKDRQNCYFLLEGNIYRIHLQTGTFEKVLSGVKNHCYISSQSNRYFAWLKEGEQYHSSTLCQMDLEDESIREICCAETDRIRPIGYLGEDIVYGVAKLEQIDLTHAGNEFFPMYQLQIENEEGEIVKTYQEDGIYVTDSEKEQHMINLTRVRWTGSGYEDALEDHIIDTDVSEDVAYGVSTRVTEKKQTQVILRFGKKLSEDRPQVVTGKILAREDNVTVEIPRNDEKEPLYYVYAGGCMDSRYMAASEAIRCADEKVGVVINQNKTFVWERGNRETTKRIKTENIPEAFRMGLADAGELSSRMQETVVDLTGCTLDMVLYFVGQGRAVQAVTAQGVVTIVGYDEYNVILLDPGSEETYYGGLQDSTKMFEEMGNQFISYLPE